MSAAQPQPTACTLHIWPSRWNLPSIDPTCIAAVFYLQLTIPGKFEVVECTNPDVSPNGNFPFLTHGHAAISSLPSIISFVSSLAKSTAPGARDLDASPSAQQRAKQTAWCSHVESSVGDLVACSFYSIDTNFSNLTSRTMTSMLPFPQRYYVSERIREMHRPRLEAAGLWTRPVSEPDKDPFGKRPKKEDYKDKYTRAFESDRVSTQAKATFALYANLLDGQKYFFGEQPTILDIYLASHILLLLNPPFPDPMMRYILEDLYPTLVEHARNVQVEVSQIPQYPIAPAQKYSLLSLIPRPLRNPVGKMENQPDETDLRFRRMRWAWFALAVGGVACYAVQLCMHTVNIGVEVRPQRAQKHGPGADQDNETAAADDEEGDGGNVQDDE